MREGERTGLHHAGTTAVFAGRIALLLVALVTAFLPCARGEDARTLTSLNAVYALTNAQANQGIPVEFTATVTYIRGYEQVLFVQSGNAALYVQTPEGLQLAVGDRVQIKGKTQGGFKPFVIADSVTLLEHGVAPAPAPALFDQLIRADFDCRLVTVYARIRDADTVVSAGVRSAFLELHMDGGEIGAMVDVDNPQLLNNLLDAEVEVTGVVSGRFDGKMQQTGILLHVRSITDVRVLRYASASPWSLPVTPMDGILSAYHQSDLSQRVRVHGTITYYLPGSTVVLQDGQKSLWIMTSSMAPLVIGDAADATGFPDVHDGFLALTGAQVRDLGQQDPIQAKASTWDQLSASRNVFDLVSIEGTVVAQVRGATQDEYVLQTNGNLFSAVYRHPSLSPDSDPLPRMRQVQPGSKVRVTGVCFMATSNNAFDTRAAFNILLRSSDDLVVLAGAPWSTVNNLVRLIGLLLVLVLAVGVWGWTLRRRVRQQTAAIKAQAEIDATQERRAVQMEQWRSRILEDINSSRPLAEIIEHITEMVSFMLNGAPCWCEINDGARLGRPPEKRSGLRIVGREIPARAGGSLGTIHVALGSLQENASAESAALSNGSRLAALAMETRKLYTDLVYRSEYDLLTDVFNRFSLERYLEEQIDKARLRASILGLIYVDLDEFKQVNDLYGHHVGDLYLQEVSARMRRQLRNGDMLARLGGDEFAALVPVIRSRAGVEEIAQRIERCFDAPFAVEGYLLRGSASLGIAIYPLDGMTGEELLKSADAAMYRAKESKRNAGEMPSHSGSLGLPFRD